MALFSQNMLELALALAEDDPDYEDFVLKFVEHFFWIAAAVDPIGDHPDEMWDEEDGFFYDVLRLPDGTGERLKVRSLVGLLPLCATTVISADVLERYPELTARASRDYLRPQPATCSANIADPFVPGVKGRRLLSLVNEDKLRRILDPDARRGALPRPPRHPLDLALATSTSPYEFDVDGVDVPRCSTSRPSRRRACSAATPTGAGPVWFPVNLLIIRALLQHYRYYGDDVHDRVPDRLGQRR